MEKKEDPQQSKHTPVTEPQLPTIDSTFADFEEHEDEDENPFTNNVRKSSPKKSSLGSENISEGNHSNSNPVIAKEYNQ